MMSGGTQVTRDGEQEAGGDQPAAESCYRGGEETEWSPEETSRSGSATQVTLSVAVALASWSQGKHLIQI